MFVLEALLLTFSTTPVVVALYPPQYRKRAAITGPDYERLIDHEDTSKDTDDPRLPAIGQHEWTSRVTVVLDKLEHLPSIIAMTQLLRPLLLEASLRDPAQSNDLERDGLSPSTLIDAPSFIQVLRLMELSDHTSAIVKSSAADSLDVPLRVFKTFCDINDIAVSSSLAIVPFDSLVTKVLDHARETNSQTVLVPWLPYQVPTSSNSTHPNGEQSAPQLRVVDVRTTSSDEALLQKETSPELHSQFVRGIFAQSSMNVALFVDRGRFELGYSAQRAILPFFGGPDDRLALAMVVQMCGDPKTTAKILRVANRGHAVHEREIEQTEHVYSAVNNNREAAGADVHHGAHGTNLVGHMEMLGLIQG